MNQLESGYYDLRAVTVNENQETETMYRREYFFDIDSFYLAREQWKESLKNRNYKLIKEIKFVRSSNQESW